LGDAELAQRDGVRGRQRAEEKFSVSAAVQRLAELLVDKAGVMAPAKAVAVCPALARSKAGAWFHRIFRR
jgi:hypothetical protein